VQQYGRKEWSENNNNPPPPISIINKKYNYTTQEEVVHVMMPSIDLWTKKKGGATPLSQELHRKLLKEKKAWRWKKEARAIPSSSTTK